MLAEFLRKSRILPQILNSAAFFNNSLVTFTFIFTYSLALQPCDRPTALETPTQLYVLPSAPILSPPCPEDPFQLLSPIAVLTFLFSFPPGYSQSSSFTWSVLTLSYIQLFCVYLYPLQYPNLYTLIAVSNHFLFSTFHAVPPVLIFSLRFSSLMYLILTHVFLSWTIFHFHVPRLVPQLLSVSQTQCIRIRFSYYYYYYYYYILLYLTRFSTFWAIIGEKLNTRENTYRKVETCRK